MTLGRCGEDFIFLTPGHLISKSSKAYENLKIHVFDSNKNFAVIHHLSNIIVNVSS